MNKGLFGRLILGVCSGFYCVGAFANGLDSYLNILASTASATDYYQVDCTVPPGDVPTHHMRFTVKDNVFDATMVGVSGFGANAAGNGKAYTVVDQVGGDGIAPPYVSIVGGEGLYVLAVFKTGAGSQVYSLQTFCEDSAGNMTNARHIVTPPVSNQ